MIEPPNEFPLARPRSVVRQLPSYEVNPVFRRSATVDQAESPLIQYFRLLNRHKGALFIAGSIGILAGVLWTVPQRPTFKARAVIEVQGLNDEFLNLNKVAPSQSGEYSSEAYLQTQIRILQSNTLLDRVVNQLQVETWPDYQADSGRIGWLRKQLNFPVAPGVRTRDRLLRQVQSNLSIQAAGLTRIVELSFDDSDPQRAAEFVNSLAAAFIESSLETRWKTTQETSQWLNRQLAELRLKLERSEDQLQLYANANGILLNAENRNVVSEKLQQLQAELSKAQADRIAKQTQYELTGNATPETLPAVLNDQSLLEFKNKLSELRRQRAELSATLNPAHPRVEKIQAQILELENTVRRSESNILVRVRNEFKASAERERLHAEEYERQARVVADQTGKSIHYNVLKREVESSRSLYDTMLQRVKEATMATALRTSNIRIVDRATPPSDPFKPSLPLNAGAGMLLGLLAGVGLVFVRDQVHLTFRQPGEPGALLNLPELGAIPAGSSNKETGLMVWEPGTNSILAECFRNSLSKIIAMMEHSDTGRVLVVTSGSSGEGKSTVATNLAVALAEVDRKVLLIDGDLRKAPANERFAPNDLRTTLASLVRGDELLDEETLRGLLPESSTRNLHLLAGGHGEGNPTHILHSRRLAQLMTLLRQMFDVVIVDTPPTLYLSDARILARLSDGVILVIRAGKTTQDEAIRVADEFTDDGTPIIGTILNSWRLTARSGNVYTKYGFK